MNKFPPLLFAHVIATAFIAQPSLAADVPPLTNHTPVCTGFGFDVNKELKLFAGTFRSVTATTTSASAADIDVDQLYVVELADQSKVTLVATPGKSSVADGSFAGLLKVSKARRYHSLSEYGSRAAHRVSMRHPSSKVLAIPPRARDHGPRRRSLR